MHILRGRNIETETALHRVEGHEYGANEIALAKRAADLLNKHYPGHLWAVFVNSEATGGVMQIKNFRISYRYGMTLHLNKLDPELQSVVRMAGEFLERAHMKRGRASGENASILEGAKHQPFGGIIV